jgi:uncharacterized protein YceK
MARRLAACALVAGLTTLAGCGTLLNLPEEPAYFCLGAGPTRQAYGGVRLDAALASGCLVGAFGEGRPEFGRGGSLLLGAYALCVVLPLSAVADTVTLPYVLGTGPGKQHPLMDLGALQEPPPPTADAPSGRSPSSPSP